uniref:Uncharacterized protein n=1 Tax=Acrobeloides nanus TaxID=290746 RepID=A0A914CMJ7_9BILA
MSRSGLGSGVSIPTSAPGPAKADDETWLCSPTNDNGVSKCKEEVFEWLKGAPTFDFQTRSALSRKLMKKRSSKKPKLPSLEDEINELLMIEADIANDNSGGYETTIVPAGSDSNNLDGKMVTSTSAVDPVYDSDSDDELFYDAPDEPEPGVSSSFEEPLQQKPLPLTEKLNIVVEQPENSILPSNLTKSYSIDVPSHHLRSSSVSPDTRSSPRAQNGQAHKISPRQSRMTTSPRIPTLTPRSSSRPPSLDSEVKLTPCKTDLSEIERRAREQEEALRAQLKQQRGRLLSSKSDQNGPESRTMSSSTSSSNTLASSQSVEFQTANSTSGRPSTSASKLPMPAKRLGMGNSKIPMPTSRTPAKTLNRPATASYANSSSTLRTTSAHGFYDTPRSTNQRSRLTIANHHSVHDNWTDDECF